MKVKIFSPPCAGIQYIYCIGLPVLLYRGSERSINMLLVTTEFIPGVNIQAIGLVKGSTIQTVNAISDFGASLKTIVGGELKRYTEMMDTARAIATDRMVQEAGMMGADAIVGVRYATSAIMASAAEVMAYGTAVRYVRPQQQNN